MPSTNEFRVFISSTFRDLQEEREHLVKKIFPEIRALCRQRGVTFTEVDLRWGLTEEDVALGQVIRTCLEEIDKCRPYFIGITGERYGYVPQLHEYYSDSALLANFPWIEEAAMQNASIIDLEFRHAMLNDPSTSDRSIVLMRRERESLLERPSSDDEERRRIEDLKRRVREASVKTEEFRDPVSLGELVYDHLVRVIRNDFGSVASPTPLEEERTRHRAFAESRRHAYIPKAEYLTRLNEWLSTDCADPLVIYAESGSGKSSLVSFWCEQVRRRQPELPVIEHYVGIGAGDADHLGIMRHVMEEIRERFGRTEELPSKPEEIEQQFANWLGFGVGRPILLAIDGINQLTGRALDLQWLPPMMPDGVKLVITSTVERTLVNLRSRGWSLLGMQPLEERERQAVVVRYLSEYHKALSAEQVRRLAVDVKCAHPLFLRTLLEELRLDSSHEQLDARIDRYLLTTGTEDLFQQVIERMEDDYGTRAVRDVMSLLWCSRGGLDEVELTELTGIGRLKLSTMLNGLDYHLVRRDGVLTFFHDYLRRAVEKRYLPEEAPRVQWYRQLAAHFEHADVTVRATLELLHALNAAGEKDRVCHALSDVRRFVQLWSADRHEVLHGWSTVDTSVVLQQCSEGLERWESEDRTEGEQASVLEALAALYTRIGALDGAEQIDRRQLVLARRQGDQKSESRVLGDMAYRARIQGRMEASEALAGEAEALAREVGDAPSICRAVGIRGVVHSDRGEYDAALACYREWESLARQLGDRRSIALAIGNRGIVHSNRGEYDDALLCAQESERMFRALGDREGIGAATANRGNVHVGRGEYDQALACFQQHERIARELGDRRGIAGAVGNCAIAYWGRGEFDEALACYREQERTAREVGDRGSIALGVGNRGIVHWALGDFDEALACYCEEERIAREIGDQRMLGLALGNHGIALLSRNDCEPALARAVEALEIHREIGYRPGMMNWLDCIALCLLDIQQRHEKMPEFLPRFVPDATGESWRLATLRLARTHAEACLRLGEEQANPVACFRARVNLARIAAAEGSSATALATLDTMLAATTDDSERADLHYWLWRLNPTDADHRAEALRLFESLIEKTPMYAYRLRIDELTITDCETGIAD